MKCFKIALIVILSIFLVSFSFVFFEQNKQGLLLQLDSGEEISIALPWRENIKSYAIGKINEDSNNYLVTLIGSRWKKYGKEVIIYSLEDEAKEIYRKDYSELKPWKIVIGDIDGDGMEDVSIGVYKESPLHKVMAKRPFIYSYIKGALQPKWRGSRLSRPFTDYTFHDIDEDGVDEIISIEILEDNRKIINSYKWKGFGFEGYLETKDYRDIDSLSIENNEIYVQVREEKGNYWGCIRLDNNNLLLERVD
ncbi:hypothetical protein [Tissierella sp.]|uniref:hypothetical protein n=1 Tax=Tissierella sp. TaxID=41274 RepID=UPI00285FF9F8|nr:hypothetical protein [Tissierella sp.]MDR7856846.1 hypothetical protein [Tissierella sp.]